MPKIPVYQTSADYRPPRGDVEAAGASGRMLAKFGEALGEFGGKIADTIAAREKADRAAQAAQATQAADAEIQRADGTAKAMASLHQTIEDFKADADPNTVVERWVGRADAVGQDIFAGIRDKGARAQVEADYGNLARVQAALLQGDSLRRLAEQGRGDLQRNLGLYADVAAGARHPVEHDDAVALALREIQGKADAGFITAEDAGHIEQTFYGDLAGRQAQRAIAADPQAALDSLKGGEDFAGLDADARARLTAEAERAVQAQAVRAQTEQAAARRDIQVRLPGYLEALRDGEVPDDMRFGRDALTATFGTAEGGKRWAEIEQARRFGQAMAKVKWATPDDIAGLTGGAGDTSPALQTLRHVPGNLDGLSETDLIRHAVDRRNQQLWSKPADYVLSNPRVAELHAAMTQATAPPLPTDAAAALQGLLPGAPGRPAEPPPMLSPENRRAAIAAYANGTLAEQERLGVPEDRRQVLPEDMAHDAVRDIAAGDPADADQRLRDLAADWGTDWPRVVEDLKRAGLPGPYALLAGLDNPVAREGFAKVLAAQATAPGALRDKAGNDADVIDQEVDTYRPILSDDNSKLVKLVAYHYAQTTEPAEAVRRAIADLGGNALFAQQPTSEADDIADAWRDKGAKLRRGRAPGEGTSILNAIVDLERGALSGARKGAQNTIDLLRETGDDINQWMIDEKGTDLTIARDLPAPTLPEVAEPQTTGGRVAQWLGEFLIGFGPIIKLTRLARGGASATTLGKFAEAEFGAAGASALTVDPYEKRFADFWNEHGLPENVWTDYLAADPDDTRAEGALKKAIESLGLGAAVGGGLFLGAKMIRALRRVEDAKSEATDGSAADLKLTVAPPRVPIIDADPHNVEHSIISFVARAFTDRKPSLLRFGRVPESAAAQAESLGVNIRDFDHVIQTDDIRHAFRGHGPGVAKKGEIPLTPADIARIPEIVETGEMRLNRPTHQGLPVLHFVKREPDGTTFVVEAVRTSRQRISVVTMYRLQRGGGGAS